jgi:hypothetical protein
VDELERSQHLASQPEEVMEEVDVMSTRGRTSRLKGGDAMEEDIETDETEEMEEAPRRLDKGKGRGRDGKLPRREQSQRMMVDDDGLIEDGIEAGDDGEADDEEGGWSRPRSSSHGHAKKKRRLEEVRLSSSSDGALALTSNRPSTYLFRHPSLP